MKSKKSKIISLIIDILVLIIAYIIISQLWHTYKINDFGDFTKAEYNEGISEFIRDDINKYSKSYSYKINSKDFNDALIYKNVKTEKNTPYKVTAMVKYENVENENQNTEGGVNIGIMDTTEKSISYTGNSNQWQKVTFEFNSKNRDNVDLVFRLGSYDDNSKGTVWFSDFKIEKGTIEENNNWNCALFIMKNIDVEIEKDGNKKHTELELNNQEIKLLKENMERFKVSMKELSRKFNDSYI